MRENGMHPTIIRAGKTNLFLSDVFTRSFVNTTGVAVEFYDGDGSFGAALGAGIGAGIFKDTVEAFKNRKPIGSVEPQSHNIHEELFQNWKSFLNEKLNSLRNESELINIA